MASVTCKICGHKLQNPNNAAVVVCDNCGITQSVPRSDDTDLLALFDKASEYRRNKKFKHSARIYNKILRIDNSNDAEAYWGLAMCENGVCYNEKYVLTVTDPSEEQFFEGENYKKAVECADFSGKMMFATAAKLIEKLRLDKRSEVLYADAEQKMERARTSKAYAKAQEIFEALGKYKEAKALAKKCKKLSDASKLKEEKLKRILTRFVLPISLIAFLLTFTLLFFINSVYPMLRFEAAIELVDNGEYKKAREILDSLGEYEDLYVIKARSYAKEGDYQMAYEVTKEAGVDFESFPLAGAYECMTKGKYSEAAKLGLNEVILPEGLTKLDDDEFMECFDLSYVKLPDSLEEIGEHAFWFALGLESIELPESLKVIGENAFVSSGIRNVEIPEGVVQIHENAFSLMFNLEGVKLPKSLEYIGQGAFTGCELLEKLEFAGNVSEWEKLGYKLDKDISVICADGVFENTVE